MSAGTPPVWFEQRMQMHSSLTHISRTDDRDSPCPLSGFVGALSMPPAGHRLPTVTGFSNHPARVVFSCLLQTAGMGRHRNAKAFRDHLGVVANGATNGGCDPRERAPIHNGSPVPSLSFRTRS